MLSRNARTARGPAVRSERVLRQAVLQPEPVAERVEQLRVGFAHGAELECVRAPRAASSQRLPRAGSRRSNARSRRGRWRRPRDGRERPPAAGWRRRPGRPRGARRRRRARARARRRSASCRAESRTSPSHTCAGTACPRACSGRSNRKSGSVEIALELPRRVAPPARSSQERPMRQRQIADLGDAAVARRDARPSSPGSRRLRRTQLLDLREQLGRHFDAVARGAFRAAKRRAPGRRTSGIGQHRAPRASRRARSSAPCRRARGSIAMNACPMRGWLPSSAKNESASKPIAAPVSAAQISSNMSASIAPFAPPVGNRLPCSIAAFASVVGLPWRSSAQPSGMLLALFASRP